MPLFDVVIIGAGPAGSAAAIALAGRGYAVAMIDKEQFPRDKLCGDFINPANWPIFRELGVDREILSKNHEKISTVRITSLSGQEAIVSIAPRNHEAFGLGLSRRDLDHVLLRAAVRKGVTVFESHRIQNLTKHPEGWGIIAKHQSALAALEAKVLIGADGRNSWVAHHMGLANNGVRPGGAAGFQFRLKNFERITGRVEIHVFPGGYAGLVQLGDGTANLCLSVTRDKLPKSSRVDLPLSLGLSLNPCLKELICGAEFFDEVRSTFPVYFSPRRPYAERVLLVGDAAQVIEPVTGEGVFFAMTSGLRAAQTIDEAFQSGDFSASRLSEYERRCRRGFRRRRNLNRLIQYLIYRPAILGHVVRISSKRGNLLGSIVNSIFLPEEVGSQSTG